MKESSLTDFLADEDAPEEESAGDGTDATAQTSAGQADESTGEPAAEAVSPADASVEPATVTAAWDPTGAACAECGETTRWRWREGDGLVCADCKSW